MAEKNDQEKALDCESVIYLSRLAEKHIQEYKRFLQSNLTEHTGLVSNCPHSEEAKKTFSQLIEILEDVKALTASHVHVVNPGNVIRAIPGRRNRIVMPQQVPVLRDSGVDSTTSQDLQGIDGANSGLNIAGAGQTENFNSASERNLRPQSNVDGNDQQTQDYTFVHEKSQTHPKSSGEPDSDTSRGKDDSNEKTDDNKKSHDS